MKCYTHFSTNSRDAWGLCLRGQVIVRSREGQGKGAATPTPVISPSPGPSPTVTSVPATLDVHATDIALTACTAAQTQFTVANTGGVPFTWTATANGAGDGLAPTSGTVDGGKQQLVQLTISRF
jgi:hypothetical protein